MSGGRRGERWGRLERRTKRATLLFIDAGGAELTMGALWLLASILGASAGAVSGMAALIDVLGFAALALTVRRPNWGAGGMALILLVSAFSSDEEHGLIGVISYIAVVALIRLGRFRQAVLLTLVTLGFGIHVSLERDAIRVPAAMFGWLMSAGLSWAIGAGFHAYGAMAELRQQELQHRGLLELAWDLHDFVARDLTIIAMQADLGIVRGGASPEELQAIADHARSANQFLRETQQRFQTTSVDTAARAITIESAVRTGEKELAVGGRQLAVAGTLRDYPRAIDAVGGRVLMEALHNAAKHGRGDVALTIEESHGMLRLVVTNRTGGVVDTSSGIGQAAMKERVATIGGNLRSGLEGDRWVMRLELPLPNAGRKEHRHDSSRAL